MKCRWLKENKAAVIAVAVTLLFAVANSMLLLKDFYYLSLLPLAGLVLLLFVVKFETGLLCMALLTPFAIDFALVPKMELSMPVEPMMILFTLMFFFRVLASRSYDLRLLRHPVSIALMLSLAWMLITSCTSSIPLVSFKYLLARLWFVVPFFFAAAQIFRDTKRIRQFFWCYAIGLIAVVCIATAKTVGNFSDLQTLHRVMRPFYNDHTAYGAIAFSGYIRLAYRGIVLLLLPRRMAERAWRDRGVCAYPHGYEGEMDGAAVRTWGCGVFHLSERCALQTGQEPPGQFLRPCRTD